MNEKYMIESNGQTYGPADVDQLIQWIAEGRVVVTTTLINSQTSERIPAGQHAGLRSWFPAPDTPTMAQMSNPSAQPPASTSYQPTPYSPPQGAGYQSTPGYQQAYRQPDTPQFYGGAPTPVLGGGLYGDMQNDSGTGSMAQLPAQLKGLSFGAFALSFWWSIFNKSYIGLLCLVPYVGSVMPFVLLFKGNEWAWQNRRFDSIEHFQAVQKSWNTWGIVVFSISAVFFVIALIAGLLGGGGSQP